MDIQSERRRLLDEEDGDQDPPGLLSEQDAYLRLVYARARAHARGVSAQ